MGSVNGVSVIGFTFWMAATVSSDQFPPAPFQTLCSGMESRVFREEDGFSGEVEQVLFAIGAAGVEDLGNVRRRLAAMPGQVPGPGAMRGMD